MSGGSKKFRTIATKSNDKDLEFVVKLIESREIKTVIDRRYGLVAFSSPL